MLVQVRYYGLSVCYNFFITLSMFPAITASAFLASDPDSKLFVPVYCFLGNSLLLIIIIIIILFILLFGLLCVVSF